jgi:nitroreductase
MPDTLDLIHQRRSIRSYQRRPIAQAQIDAIIGTAMRAPTAGNMMLYSIIEIGDQNLKERLAETCDHQPFIAKAPLVLLFVADYQRWNDLFDHFDVDDYCRRLNTEELGRLLDGPSRRAPREPARNAGQAYYRQKFAADFSREMTRSVRAALAAWCEGRPSPAAEE